jgi:hypothetical protein
MTLVTLIYGSTVWYPPFFVRLLATQVCPFQSFYFIMQIQIPSVPPSVLVSYDTGKDFSNEEQLVLFSVCNELKEL